MKIGFIGLGRMGQGIANNLARSSYELIVFDMFEQATQTFKKQGVRVAPSVAELTNGADIVFTSLPGPSQVREVALGEGGILENISEGGTYVDLSTNSHALVLELSQRFAEKRAFMLDAPVSGGPAGAASGDLAIWAGGDKGAFERCKDVLDAVSNDARYMGGPGTGTVTKLAHNLLGNLMLTSMAEVFTLGFKGGVEPLELWEALRGGMVGRRSPLEMLVEQFLPGQYDQPKMQLKLGHKDITLAVGMGRELGVPLRLSALVLEELTEAIGRGLGDQDSRAFMKLQLERAGVNIAVDPERIQQARERQRRAEAAQPGFPAPLTAGL
jgi:3-hydroxyisobutyrate dehydrogenase